MLIPYRSWLKLDPVTCVAKSNPCDTPQHVYALTLLQTFMIPVFTFIWRRRYCIWFMKGRSFESILQVVNNDWTQRVWIMRGNDKHITSVYCLVGSGVMGSTSLSMHAGVTRSASKADRCVSTYPYTPACGSFAWPAFSKGWEIVIFCSWTPRDD